MEPSRLCIGRCGFFERARLGSEVGVEIDLSGIDRFVPEPKSDDTAVVAGFEKPDGGCVTQDVRGYVLFDESRALLASGSSMLFDEQLDGVAAQGAAATAREQRFRWRFFSLLEPVPENRDRLGDRGIGRCLRPLPRQRR